MKHLIDKSALVAKIERLRKSNKPKEDKDYAQFELDVSCGYNMALDDVEKFLDTLEVKEVDDEPGCKIFPRPIECYSNCKECPFLATNNKAQKEENRYEYGNKVI